MAASPLVSGPRAFDLDAADWERYLGGLAADGQSVLTGITLGPADGARSDGWAIGGWSLRAIRFDRRADEIEIDAGRATSGGVGLRYFISCPRSIKVQEHGRDVTISVVDASGARTMIQLSQARAAGALRSRGGAV